MAQGPHYSIFVSATHINNKEIITSLSLYVDDEKVNLYKKAIDDDLGLQLMEAFLEENNDSLIDSDLEDAIDNQMEG